MLSRKAIAYEIRRRAVVRLTLALIHVRGEEASTRAALTGGNLGEIARLSAEDDTLLNAKARTYVRKVVSR